MAGAPFSHPAFVLFLVIFKLFLLHVLAKHVYEGGYTVTTVLDGNKLDINPHSVAPRAGVSHDLLFLDSSNSAFFTVSLPISQDSVTKKFSGSGVAGFSDGESDTAMFNKPRSFAVDSKGNVYVADRNNLAIRKISSSGVTTIAGGDSDKPGRSDGSGQNASFSRDFGLAYIPDMCALLISDHGNKLVRQINLKPEDCGSSSRSGISLPPSGPSTFVTRFVAHVPEGSFMRVAQSVKIYHICMRCITHFLPTDLIQIAAIANHNRFKSLLGSCCAFMTKASAHRTRVP